MATDLTFSADSTIRNERRDFSEWHRGRSIYALWALQFDTTPLKPRMQAAQEALADLLLPGYERQPHVTLSLCGFPSAQPQFDDDFGPALVQAQLRTLQQANPTGFEIAIGGLDSFTSVPYFTVRDTAGQLHALRHCLQQTPAIAAHGDYTPHVTIGLYVDVFPMDYVLQRLRAVALPADLHLPVTGLSLLGYQAAHIGGPLHCVASYAFADQALQWHGAPWFALDESLVLQ
ncbi:2'-5' RNA ligase family protein [Rhodoferax sp. GW822-FHT02A01]|uniref:2'-5' RNA ligase family protein n=1 Tax=Rhodoferax sp. GW822-FHT02A01 TaxID=3141537 RepID=UPI00315D7F07